MLKKNYNSFKDKKENNNIGDNSKTNTTITFHHHHQHYLHRHTNNNTNTTPTNPPTPLLSPPYQQHYRHTINNTNTTIITTTPTTNTNTTFTSENEIEHPSKKKIMRGPGSYVMSICSSTDQQGMESRNNPIFFSLSLWLAFISIVIREEMRMKREDGEKSG